MRSMTLIALIACAFAVTGCRGWTTDKAPIVPVRNMYNQARYDTQEQTEFFADKRTMRPQVEGTVPYDAEVSLALSTGWDPEANQWIPTIPARVVMNVGSGANLLARGQDRYDIYCTPCHSELGDGKGMISRRAEDLNSGLVATNLHDPRLRAAPDGQLFAVISNGIGRMPAYDYAIPVQDRWAIVAYVRALQLSQAPAVVEVAPAATDVKTTEQAQ